jgi:hypothetical protein
VADLPTNWVDNAGMVEDAAFLNLVGTNVNANTKARPTSGAFSALPAAGNTGKLYYATDAGVVLRDNGTSWDVVGGNGESAFTPPPSAGWSTTTLGTATIAADKGGRLLSAPSAGSAAPLIEYRTLSPASNYTLTGRVDLTSNPQSGTCWGGIFLRANSSGNAVFFGAMTAGANPAYLLCAKSTPTNLRSSDYTNIQAHMLPCGVPRWLQVRDDGANRYFEFSYDGVTWCQVTSTTRTDYITPDQYGWGGANNASGVPSFARLRSLRLS